MIRRIRITFTVFLLGTMITGCWSRRELNDLAITVALGFDKKGKQYQISAQVVNPGEVATKKGSSKGAPVVTYSETGDTVFEALHKMTTKSPRRLYLSHLRMLIISEQLAKEGIGKTLDFLSRDHELRTDFYIAVAKGLRAEKILEIYAVPQEIIPANHIYKSIQASSQIWAAAGKVTIDDLISNIAKGEKQPVLTGIDLTGNKEKKETGTMENVRNIKPISSLRISDLAVFKKDKLVGWLDEEDSKAYNYMQGNVKNTVGHVSCPKGGKLTLEVLRSKSVVKAKITHGEPEINVELQMEDNVADVECEIDLTEVNTISELESRAEKKVKELLVKVINKAQKELKTDIFGFGEALHRSAPKEWRKMKNNWDQEFVDLPVNVTVDVKIRRLGTITDAFMKEKKE
jgi:spore germination protein KC